MKFTLLQQLSVAKSLFLQLRLERFKIAFKMLAIPPPIHRFEVIKPYFG